MKSILLLLLSSCALLPSVAAGDIPIVDTWKYTYRRPAEGWRKVTFDEAGWKEGAGGFGMPETPGSRVGTYWQTNNLWLRKRFEVESIPEKPALLIHHDEDAEVYINGRRAAAFKGYITEYKVVPLSAEAKTLLRQGENVMAVHCRQTGGGQFIDVHVVDAENVPELPPAQRSHQAVRVGADHTVGGAGHTGECVDRVSPPAAAAGCVAESERSVGVRDHVGRSA